ncbi:hypothetical protein GCM10025883_18100 [Mobilicoccus caccae]|uniref:DUF3071 domain-containing protein n=1 Tax=Mobilicoccus caccae TaxID=1859295 RepID=A0ABQ6IQZ7_9MICO|nr:hypothetical protein GCM10025883_18100 [Mobilicoccus caccae]
MSPVEVQALIRSGADAEEAAERAGWTVEKVRRYEGPILAEREHVARLASNTRLRPRGATTGSPTLLSRVTRRLADRDVSIDDVDWDSWRNDDGQWVVEVHFEEQGHHRRASWSFAKSSMTLRGLDQEAARLSDDDPDLLDPGPEYDRGRDVTDAGTQYGHAGSYAPQAHRSPLAEDSDLMATLRSTSRARNRRRGGGARRSPSAVPPAVDTEDLLTTAGSGTPTTAPAQDELRPDPGLTGTDDHLAPDPGSPAAPELDEPEQDEPEAPTPAPTSQGIPARVESDLHADPGLAGTERQLAPDPGSPTLTPADPAPANEEPLLPFEDEITEIATPAPTPTPTPAPTPTPEPTPPTPVTSEAATSDETTSEETPKPQPAPRAKRTRRRKATAPAQEVSPPQNQNQNQNQGLASATDIASAPAPETQPEPEPAAEQTPKPASRKAAKSSSSAASRRRGRASVPAWDDIMFGAKAGEDPSARDE